MFEVDGFGNGYFMDDANQPSLLGMPLYGFIAQDDPIYLNTRVKVLSTENPFYFSGSAAAGVGGPHVGCYDKPPHIRYRLRLANGSRHLGNDDQQCRRDSSVYQDPHLNNSKYLLHS